MAGRADIVHHRLHVGRRPAPTGPTGRLRVRAKRQADQIPPVQLPAVAVDGDGVVDNVDGPTVGTDMAGDAGREHPFSSAGMQWR